MFRILLSIAIVVLFAGIASGQAPLQPPPTGGAIDSLIAALLGFLVQFATGSEAGAWIATIVGFLLAAHPLASAFVNWTDTPADDAWLAWFYKNVIERLALVRGKAKQLPGGGTASK